MTSEENQNIAVTDTVIEYMIDRNLDGLRSILDKDFTLTHITGYVQSIKEWLSDIETEGMKYYSAKKIKHDINVSGNEALSTFQHLLDAHLGFKKYMAMATKNEARKAKQSLDRC